MAVGATWLEEEELQPLFMYTVQFVKLYCGQEYPTCCWEASQWKTGGATAHGLDRMLL